MIDNNSTFFLKELFLQSDNNKRNIIRMDSPNKYKCNKLNMLDIISENNK